MATTKTKSLRFKVSPADLADRLRDCPQVAVLTPDAVGLRAVWQEGDTVISHRIPAEIMSEGEIALSKTAIRYIAKVKGDVEIMAEGKNAIISGGNFSATFAQWFPGNHDERKPGDLVAKVPRTVVERASACAKMGDAPGAMGNLCIRGRYLAATDSHRLSVAELDDVRDVEEYLVPAGAVNRVFLGGGDVVEFYRGDIPVVVCGERTVSAPPYGGVYPKFEKLAEEPERATNVAVKAKALADALSRAAPFGNYVSIEIEGDMVTLRAFDPREGSFAETIEGEGVGKGRARFQSRFLKAMVKAAEDEVVIRIREEEEPSYWVLSQTEKMIIMPAAWAEEKE